MFPTAAQENGIFGRVIISFVVKNDDGTISDAKVTKSVADILDNEALKVVKSMPRWEAGKINGLSVNVKFELPFNFD
mgnify:FL=1